MNTGQESILAGLEKEPDPSNPAESNAKTVINPSTLLEEEPKPKYDQRKFTTSELVKRDGKTTFSLLLPRNKNDIYNDPYVDKPFSPLLTHISISANIYLGQTYLSEIFVGDTL